MIKITYVSRADLECLMMRFGKIRVEAEKGETVFLQGVGNHDVYYNSGYKHVFDSTVIRDGEEPTRGTVTLASKDNEIFTGTIEYQKHFGGEMAD